MLTSQKVKQSSNSLTVQGFLYFGLAGCPTRIRADCGSENVSIAACQMLLRHQHHDCYAGSNSFVFGSSIRNTVSTYFYNFIYCYALDSELKAGGPD